MKLHPWLRGGLIALLLIAVLAGQSWATYRLFTAQSPGGNDFYSRWANGCALIWTGENPYSEEVTLRTQRGIWGHPARPGQDKAAYSYPLYTLFFFWPLCFVQPYPLVQAIWMTLMLYLLVAGVALTVRIAGWNPPKWLWAVTLLWTLINYPHARAIVLGQMATVVFFALMAAIWLMLRGLDSLGGATLAAATIKPQMSFLLLPWILWWTAWRGRWRVWQGFALMMVLLIGLSCLLVPTWPIDFLEDVRNYDVVTGMADYRSLTWIVLRHFLGMGPAAEVVGVGAFSAYVLWEAWRRRKAAWDGFLWTVGLLLVLTHFIAPRTATTHYTMLLLPLFAFFARLSGQVGPQAHWAVLSAQITLFLSQWTVFLATLQGNYETAAVYLPFPILVLFTHLISRPKVQVTQR